MDDRPLPLPAALAYAAICLDEAGAALEVMSAQLRLLAERSVEHHVEADLTAWLGELADYGDRWSDELALNADEVRWRPSVE